MSPSGTTNKATQEEWRELGFYYEIDAPACEWRFRGSRSGLLRFAKLLDDYVAVPGNNKLSEHEHYGPYMYLKIVTWTEPSIDEFDIRGTLEDLRKLASIVRERVEKSSTRESFIVGPEYAKKSHHHLLFSVESDDFDPAKADVGCW